MLKLGRLFNPRANHPSTAPISNKSRLFKTFPWLAGFALAFGVPAVINAQHAPASKLPNVKAVSTANIDKPSEDNSKTKAEVNIQKDDTSSDETNYSSNHVSTHVTVNGHHIDVPANGSVHKTVTDDNGNHSNIDISISNKSQGSSSNQTNSSSSVNVFSQSNSVNLQQEDSE